MSAGVKSGDSVDIATPEADTWVVSAGAAVEALVATVPGAACGWQALTNRTSKANNFFILGSLEAQAGFGRVGPPFVVGPIVIPAQLSIFGIKGGVTVADAEMREGGGCC